ncbi:hypothetical protein [Salmonella phage SD-2_S15]|nr:hypothetical protein [Salmonella phage SD-2_S15]
MGNYSPPDVKHYTLLNLVCKYSLNYSGELFPT